MKFSLSEDLLLALNIIDHVDELTIDRFRSNDLVVETKPDLTPVSDADKKAEQIVRDLLARSRPDDEIYGEEQGGSLEHSARRWILDPIDGTKNFVRGVPVWATLLALESNGEVILGVVSAPALGRRWWAAKGMGAFVRAGTNSAEPLRVSGVSRIKDASLSYSSLTGWDERGQSDSFHELATTCWRSRAYADFWSYMMVAEGTADIAAEPELEIYDMAALVPIVVEAGGTFTSLEGEPGPWGSSAIASNTLLHEEARDILGAGSTH